MKFLKFKKAPLAVNAGIAFANVFVAGAKIVAFAAKMAFGLLRGFAALVMLMVQVP